MILGELIKRLIGVERPVTNLFPVKYMPPSLKDLLAKVERGEAQTNPPVPTPAKFRGKITYEREKCIGCRQCLRVCPSKAIKFKEEEEKIEIYVSRCTFCSLCNDICPVNCLHMDEEDFLLSDGEKFSEKLTVKD